MTASVSARDAKALIHGEDEIAVIDVREAGQFGEGHLFYAVNLPYSRLEAMAPVLVPNPRVACLLCADDGALAERAARRLASIGYTRLMILDGGTAAWATAGYQLFKGINVPSKAFGEIVEHACHTPSVTAAELAAWQKEGRPHLLIDGRPFAEFRRMSIPGARCMPNGEPVYRLPALLDDPTRPIVVNCAGRTRSLIGAQGLINAGLPNPVCALENGTQGWALAGLTLDRGRESPPLPAGPVDPAAGRALAERLGVPMVPPERLGEWRADPDRTLFVLDVRMADEFAAGHLPGSRHAPGGQLVQATDLWIGVRRARVALIDDDGRRAAVTASWLRQMGHHAYVVEGALDAGPLETGAAPPPALPGPVPPAIDAKTVAADLEAGIRLILDLRGSMAFRRESIPGSRWAIRPTLDRAGLGHDGAMPVTLVGDAEVAALAALDLAEAGAADVTLLDGGIDAWRDAGLPLAASPDTPADAEALDFLFFVHDRHDGNAEASRAYLAWELGLVGQLDAQERAEFRPLVTHLVRTSFPHQG